MIVYKCDVCERIDSCDQHTVDGKTLDVCKKCWDKLNLEGKGRDVYPVQWQPRWQINYPQAPFTYTGGSATPYLGHATNGRLQVLGNVEQ